jgi:hypothetical protein
VQTVSDSGPQVLVRALQNESANTLAKFTCGKECSSRAERTTPHNRAACAVLFQPANCGDNVVAGRITEVVSLACRIAMCSQSDKQDWVTGCNKPLSLIEATRPRAAVAMKK